MASPTYSLICKKARGLEKVLPRLSDRPSSHDYMVTLQGLQNPPHEWKISGTPLTAMMALEERKGKQKPVIQKSLVDLEGPLFKEFTEKREGWKKEDAYLDPGPIQY